MASVELTILCMLVFCFVMVMISFTAAIRIVPENKRLMVYRLGRYVGEKGPGVVLLIPIIDRGVAKELGTLEQVSGGLARRMVGWSAKTSTSVFRDGGQVVLQSGESVDAVSETPIPADKAVRVKRVIVEVESVE